MKPRTRPGENNGNRRIGSIRVLIRPETAQTLCLLRFTYLLARLSEKKTQVFSDFFRSSAGEYLPEPLSGIVSVFA